MPRPSSIPRSELHYYHPDCSAPWGKTLKGFPASPDDRGERFRTVLASVILPISAVKVDPKSGDQWGTDAEPIVGGYFKRGRYRGLSSIDFPMIGDNGSGIPGTDRDRFRAPHEPPEQWLSRRLWVATGGMKEAPVPEDFQASRWEVDFDPAVARSDSGRIASSQPTEYRARWNHEMDSHCAYFGANKIAYLRDGNICLRAVEILRFTGCDRHHSDDFMVMHLTIENPTADEITNFTRSLRTGEQIEDLRPTPRWYSRANWAFAPEGAEEGFSNWRTLSVPELLEFHAKLAVKGMIRPEEGENKESRPKPAEIFFRVEDGRLTMDRQVKHEKGNIEVDFTLDGGYTTVRECARTGNATFDRRRIFTLSCAIPYPDCGLPAAPLSEMADLDYKNEDWTCERQWAHILAAGPSQDSLFPADTSEGAAEGVIPSPAGWLDCVTEFGYATVRTSGSLTLHPDPFRLCQTRYVELALLAIRQLYAVELMSEKEGNLPGTTSENIVRTNEKLAELQQEHLDFRRELWFSHIPRRMAATRLLTGIQQQLGVDKQLGDLADDLNLRFEILTSFARAEEERAREAQRDSERLAETEAAEKRERLEFGLALVSILIAIPSFSAITTGPSWTTLGLTLAATLVFAIILIIASRTGALTWLSDRLFAKKPKS